MVRSKALLFSWKKITFFLKKIICYWICTGIQKNVEKSCDARFFGDKTILRFFLDFQKKVKKNEKNAFFLKKSLWSHPHFSKKSCHHLSCKIMKKRFKKKCQKKTIFVFWNFFLKMKIGHFFLSIFEIKKKVLKT